MDKEHEIEETAAEAERTGDEMEKHLDELDEHIDEAKSVAAQRPDAPEQSNSGLGI